METTVAILMVLGIYLGIPAIIGFAIAGVYLFVDRRVRRTKRVGALAEAQLEQPAEVPGEAVVEETTEEPAVGTKAYFLVKMAEGLDEERKVAAQREVEAIPEVKSVEPVSRAGELLVTVEAPIKVILVAHKVMAKGWVERLRYVTIEEAQALTRAKVTPPGVPKTATKEPEALHVVTR